ncbi:hypothetical protein GCM10011512_08690 [Tersicoccus solisilvae]|uniref:Uncharacterized protein n=1 Tax=Tersicoccus solisilvae TaxID=1882339 RepID=A0ABQ1NU85_9MICC|nr:hypothetical protein [Tersicoccus solisilvae]GGC84140.1 hypothetical protein GCM10011512_08690 [Tersicoccus solisilvae]
MSVEQPRPWPADHHRWQSRRIALHRFRARDTVGAGELVKDLTSALGIAPCPACERRAARLDRLRLPRIGRRPAP